MIASCGDPSTHFIAKTILRHSYRLGSRWTPPFVLFAARDVLLRESGGCFVAGVQEMF